MFLIQKMNYLTHQLLNPQEINLLKKNLFLKTYHGKIAKKLQDQQKLKIIFNLIKILISKKYTELIEKKILNDVLIKSLPTKRFMEQCLLNH